MTCGGAPIPRRVGAGAMTCGGAPFPRRVPKLVLLVFGSAFGRHPFRGALPQPRAAVRRVLRAGPPPRACGLGGPPPLLASPLRYRFAPGEDARATGERLSGATPPPFLSAGAVLSLDVVVSLSARPRAQQGARFGCQAAERPIDTHDRHREKEKKLVLLPGKASRRFCLLASLGG